MDFQDYHAIHNLLARYTYVMDSGQFDVLEEIFAHCALYLPGDSEPSSTDGKGFRRIWEKWNIIYPETGTPRTRHVLTNISIHLDSTNAAHSHSYFTVFQSLPDFPLQPICAGSYHDCFQKTGAGEWIFVERREVVDQLGDLSRHLRMAYQPPDE